MANATVSHELRNPLQAISCQNLKIELCFKEIMKIIKEEKSVDKEKLKKIFQNIQSSNKI